MKLKIQPAAIAVFVVVMATDMMTSSMALPPTSWLKTSSQKETVIGPDAAAAAVEQESPASDSASDMSIEPTPTRDLHKLIYSSSEEATSGTAASNSGNAKLAARKSRSALTSYYVPIVREGLCQSDMSHFRWCYRCGRAAGDEPRIYHDCCRQVEQVLEFCDQMLY